MLLLSHPRNPLAAVLDLDIVEAGLFQQITVPAVGLSSTILPLLHPVNFFFLADVETSRECQDTGRPGMRDYVTLSSCLLGQMVMTIIENRQHDTYKRQVI